MLKLGPNQSPFSSTGKYFNLKSYIEIATMKIVLLFLALGPILTKCCDFYQQRQVNKNIKCIDALLQKHDTGTLVECTLKCFRIKWDVIYINLKAGNVRQSNCFCTLGECFLNKKGETFYGIVRMNGAASITNVHQQLQSFQSLFTEGEGKVETDLKTEDPSIG